MNIFEEIKDDSDRNTSPEDEGLDISDISAQAELVLEVPGGRSDIISRERSCREISRMCESKLFDTAELVNRRLLYPGIFDEPAGRSFIELRTKLQQVSRETNAVVMVTSVCAGGGASFVAFNLAVAIALDQSRTSLIIDCHRKRPLYSDLLSLDHKKGLIDYLQYTEVGEDEIIHAIGIPRVRLIPLQADGQSSVLEYFESVRMARLVDNLARRYRERWVIIDSPSMCESSQTTVLAGLSNQVVLVVPYGEATQRQIKGAVAGIGRNKIAGVVFNRTPAFQLRNSTHRDQ